MATIWVTDLSLVGAGPGRSADHRLNALRNMIEAAGDLIDDGELEMAWEQLWNAFDRCDGESPPPDFVEGPAAAELNALIAELLFILATP